MNNEQSEACDVVERRANQRKKEEKAKSKGRRKICAPNEHQLIEYGGREFREEAS
jgi:hypothetical protein